MGNKKLKIAVTGSIGSGKSLFTGFIREKGYTVIKADDVSKEILASDSAVRKKVIEIFGEASFTGNEINRKYLAEKVFSNSENVLIINSILHPIVIKRIAKMMDEELKLKNKVFVEAALIYEASMEDKFDYIILITADQELRYKRKAGEIDYDDFLKRNSNQIPDEEKRKAADFTFENNESIEELKKKAELLLALIG
jgi:dephospho-CoA kinase